MSSRKTVFDTKNDVRNLFLLGNLKQWLSLKYLEILKLTGFLAAYLHEIRHHLEEVIDNFKKSLIT